MEALLNKLKGDRSIWMWSLFMALASLILVYTSINTLAQKHHDGNTSYYLFRHGFFLLSGFVLMFAVHKIKYTYWSKLSMLLVGLSIPLLLFTLLLGSNINDASRWLTIPVINQSFQTSDLAKLAIITYVARILSRRKNELDNIYRGFFSILLPVGAICALILPANFSTAALLFLVCTVIMFLGGIPIRHLLLLIPGAIFVVGTVFSIATVAPDTFPRMETWKNRIVRFAGIETENGQEERHANYQVEQSKIAIATGGIYGKGPGNSTQRNFLPHPYSDFIFAIVLEEYGLIGGITVLLFYLILLFRTIRIAIKCERTFGSLLAAGLGGSLVLQALVNMAVAVNLVPVTGQPLPLLSMGGTSIWFTCITLGVILSVSRSLEPSSETQPIANSKNSVDAAIA